MDLPLQRPESELRFDMDSFGFNWSWMKLNSTALSTLQYCLSRLVSPLVRLHHKFFYLSIAWRQFQFRRSMRPWRNPSDVFLLHQDETWKSWRCMTSTALWGRNDGLWFALCSRLILALVIIGKRDATRMLGCCYRQHSIIDLPSSNAQFTLRDTTVEFRRVWRRVLNPWRLSAVSWQKIWKLNTFTIIIQFTCTAADAAKLDSV